MRSLWNTPTALISELIPAPLKRWLKNISINDPVEYKQASLLQRLLIGLVVLTLLTLPFGFVVAPTIGAGVRANISSIFILIFFIVAIVQVRQGNLRACIMTVSAGMLVGFTGILFIEGVRHSAWLLPAFMMPLTLVGLLAGRRGILLGGSLSITLVVVVGGLQLTTTGIVGMFPREGDLLPSIISTFALSTIIVVFFFHRFSGSLREALTTAQDALGRSEVLVVERTAALNERTAALEELRLIRDNLEIIVGQRTAALEEVLHTVEDREANLERTNALLADTKAAIEEINRLKATFLDTMPDETRSLLNADINFTAFLNQHDSVSKRISDSDSPHPRRTYARYKRE